MTIELLTERVAGKIYFLMDTLPHPKGEFVELEDSKGNGISIGRWVKLKIARGDLFALEIDDPRSEYDTTTDLNDQEIECIHAGLVALAIATEKREVRDEAMAVIRKLGLEAPPPEVLAGLGDA